MTIHLPRPSASTPSAGPCTPWWRQLRVLVLAGGLLMGMALGVRHVQGLFMLPIIAERGWSRETFAFAMAVQNLAWGLAQPFTGMLADRYGSWKVMAGGLALYAAGLYGMTQAHTSTALAWSAGLCIGIALSGTTFGVVYGALSRMTGAAQRSRALGLAGAVGGIAQFALVPGVQALLAGTGWAGALLLLAVVLAALVPLALPFQDRGAAAAPDHHAPDHHVPDGAGRQPLHAAVREAFGHAGFWLLNLGFLACGFQLAFVASHLPAYLLDRGMRPADGMAALAIIALANVAGIYACGLLGGRYSKKYLLAGIYLARTATMALFLLLPLSPATLYGFSAAMGLLWLGTVPLTNGILAQVFGVRYLATLFGFVFLGHQLGSFLGVWLGGLVFELTRSYDAVWYGAMGLGIVAAALHSPIDDRQIVRSGLAPARP
ncbi:putative transporter, Major facilitator superfamily (plasmid) [Cupriavidus taiwanensis]|uniref:Putative transporter, Major facilitator superfamily n=1 Tax=Cupriavidus taiwanensis TaxID=164546 RepID=A0A375IIG9_9BURK|nr:MFS transporter [Cupriavidus taiwanensis]SPK74553.1 putative transporter, Major facilitator superfamily [Cupriavidus taiwanensis]